MRPLDTSVFHPDSPQARAIEQLFYVDLTIAAFIFLTVAGLVVYVAWRFRERPGAAEPVQDEGDPRLETLWTVVPGAILLVLLLWTARTMAIVQPLARSHPPDVVVVAHQWWWEYHYPASGVVTANELHLGDGRTWLLAIESADVIHDFWVPDLGAKVDAVPGRRNYLWIEPQRDGTFLGTCAEYCGAQHALMGIRVVVEPPSAYLEWTASQLQIPAAPTEGPAAEGARIFAAKTCRNCHRIAGTAAAAQVGPDLTHVADRQTLGAGVLENTPANLARWIRNPQRFKPGCHMPDMRLTDDDARAVAAYLEGLR
jgi:cytochrome c oxidase subunit II